MNRILIPKNISRVAFLAALGGVVAAPSLLGRSIAFAAPTGPGVSADKALELLIEGNKRFIAGSPTHQNQDVMRREELSAGQSPFAVILGCSDSRVSPTIVFDRGLGDLFVISVAGNITEPAGIGSIEYAVDHLNVQLVMVLGHEKCGAVSAACDAVKNHTVAEGHVQVLIDAIAPAVKRAERESGDLVSNTVRENVIQSVTSLKTSEPILAKRSAAGTVMIVGGVYHLGTGQIELVHAS